MLKKVFFVTLIVFSLLIVVTIQAFAMKPESYESEYYEEPYILADCHEYGYDFLIEDYAIGSGKSKVFFNQDGSINRIQEHFSGYDVMTNLKTGKQDAS